MEFKLLNQVIKWTLIAALFSCAVFTVTSSFWNGLEVLFGALWSCGNVILLKYLFTWLFSKQYLKTFSLLGIKFPLLYFIGYFLLTTEEFPPWNLMFGFSLLFIVLFCLSISQAALKKMPLMLLFFVQPLQATLDAEVPEIPNFLGILHKIFHNSTLLQFLSHWDTIVYSVFTATAISLIFHFGIRHRSMIPSGLQNFLESLVEILRNFILDILGPDGEKFIPFIGTLFIYILTMNWLVLIPLMKAPTSNFNITVALAICVFCRVQYLNIKNYGIKGFLYHMAGSPKDFIGWIMVPLMFPIEVLTQFTRPVTLALRLFGNVVGEDILIGAFALFGVYMLEPYLPNLGIPLQIPFMFLALLTGLMQALVFSLLTTIYILLSVPGYEDH